MIFINLGLDERMKPSSRLDERMKPSSRLDERL
jgi:hypothetical protein